jgi:hypothetical protein
MAIEGMKAFQGLAMLGVSKSSVCQYPVDIEHHEFEAL